MAPMFAAFEQGNDTATGPFVEYILKYAMGQDGTMAATETSPPLPPSPLAMLTPRKDGGVLVAQGNDNENILDPEMPIVPTGSLWRQSQNSTCQQNKKNGCCTLIHRSYLLHRSILDIAPNTGLQPLMIQRLEFTTSDECLLESLESHDRCFQQTVTRLLIQAAN
jgi:hypothetical protein